MDHETDKQEPSSKEGGQVKVGDKVWVVCEVVNRSESSAWVEVGSRQGRVWVNASDCRPVEPPVVKDSLTTEPTCLEIPNSSSEPMRAAFEADLIQQMGWNQSYFSRNENQYFDSQIEIIWQAFKAGAKYQSSSLATSPCVDGVNVDEFIEGVMEARGRTSDPINPAHYKQGGIECIDAIKAATGDGFISYVWGNVLKYLWRWPRKGGVDDLKKARWYLDRLIKEVGE
jgi:hypothetical protein